MTRGTHRSVLQAATCPVCLDTLKAPLITPCEHSFCRDCIHLALQHSKLCPVCRQGVASHRVLRESSVICELASALSEGSPAPAERHAMSTTSTVGNTWDCGTCTLANPLAAARCMVCNSRQPAPVLVCPRTSLDVIADVAEPRQKRARIASASDNDRKRTDGQPALEAPPPVRCETSHSRKPAATAPERPSRSSGVVDVPPAVSNVSATKRLRRLALLEAANGHEPNGKPCAVCGVPRDILNTSVTWSDAAKTRLTFHYSICDKCRASKYKCRAEVFVTSEVWNGLWSGTGHGGNGVASPFIG